MDVLSPRSLDEALEMKAARPEAVPIAGGTDVMVEVNFDRSRPPAMMDVCRLPELLTWRRADDHLYLGAGVPYARIMRELQEFVPLVEASRTVGSPQIRNRGTVGGNAGTASPAGDALPVLAAYDAEVVLGSASAGRRSMTWNEFLLGAKRTAIDPHELILGFRWRITRGPGSFSKVGTRNAMIISMAGLCLVLDEESRSIRVALGSVGPTIIRATDAEGFAAQMLGAAGAWDDPLADVAAATIDEFGERAAAAARPIDDVRGTASYRRHACAVLARRALSWALLDRRTNAAGTA